MDYPTARNRLTTRYDVLWFLKNKRIECIEKIDVARIDKFFQSDDNQLFEEEEEEEEEESS